MLNHNRGARGGPILVTGAHRSGTTWVGKMLAASSEIGYISEPLNVHHRPGVMLAPVEHWYTYICQDNQDRYLPALRDTVRFRYHFGAELSSLRSIKDCLRMARDWWTFTLGRYQGHRPLLKDPFAVFSAPWFAQTLDCALVIVVRHPAAFTSSLMRLDWSFDFSDLLAQPYLMRDLLEPYRAQMEQTSSKPQDFVAQSALLWNMVYQFVDELRSNCPEAVIVRHEDLSEDPEMGFRGLYAELGLPFTPGVEDAVRKSSAAGNPKEISTNTVHSVRVDSRANLKNWQRRLSQSDIERLRELTAEAAALFYRDEEWQ